ncbi:hypothetical protein [Nocardia amamiensis]|uniref:hypothetical protein n=1 Tax=Nocardia amamiensis TaxID=404578 RepID=UPI001E578EDB|nr:hypothetical protein [Nocardia amamiensis]
MRREPGVPPLRAGPRRTLYGRRLLPGNTAACNPSMTIAAVAERALDNIVARDIGTLI